MPKVSFMELLRIAQEEANKQAAAIKASYKIYNGTQVSKMIAQTFEAGFMRCANILKIRGHLEGEQPADRTAYTKKELEQMAQAAKREQKAVRVQEWSVVLSSGGMVLVTKLEFPSGGVATHQTAL